MFSNWCFHKMFCCRDIINRTNRGSLFGFTCAIQCFDDGDLFFMLMQRDKIGQTLGVVFFLGVTCEIHWFDSGLKHKTKTPIQSKPVVFFCGLIKHSNACKQKMNHFHRAITYHFLTILILKSGVRPPRHVPGDIHENIVISRCHWVGWLYWVMFAWPGRPFSKLCIDISIRYIFCFAV